SDRPLLLNLPWGLQRILQHPRKIAPLRLAQASAADDRVTAVNGRPNNRRGLNYAIEDNREAMAHICFGDLPECFRAFSIEPECDFPSFLTVSGSRLRNMVAAEICLLFDEQTFFDRLSALNLLFVSLDSVFWRNHVLSIINRFQALTVVRIHEAEL